MAVDPSLFNGITGSTDSELVFHLALTFGLEDDPLGAMEQAIGFVESTASERGVASPVQGTFGISDGERLWAIRYSSDHDSRTLFVSADVDAVRRLHPENERLQRMSEGDRVVVSEPLSDLPAPGTRSQSRPRSSSPAASWSTSPSGPGRRPLRGGHGQPATPAAEQAPCHRPIRRLVARVRARGQR